MAQMNLLDTVISNNNINTLQPTNHIINMKSINKYTPTKWHDFIVCAFLRSSSEGVIPSALTELIAICIFVKSKDNHIHRWEYWNKADPYYIKPVYKNAKEEMLKGPFKLSRDNWNQNLRKSRIFCESWSAPRYYARSSKFNEICGVTAGTQMDIKYVVIARLYQDFDRARAKYNEIMKSNDYKKIAEVAHFTRLLIEIVNLYGREMSDDEKIYYAVCHAGSASYYQNTVNTTSYFPLFATASYNSARYYTPAKEHGYTLQVTKGSKTGDCLCFDFSRMGDNYQEGENCLIYGDNYNVDALYSKDIHHSPHKFTKIDLSKLGVIQKIIKGSFLVYDEMYSWKYDECKNEFAVLLNNYLYRKIQDNDDKTSITCINHKQHLFDDMMDKIDTIYLNKLYFKNGIDSFIDMFNKSDGIFLNHNYKFVSLPVFTLKISNDDTESKSVDFKSDIGCFRIMMDVQHVYKSGYDDTSKIKRVGIMIQSINTNEDQWLSFEYELFIEDIGYYQYYTMSDSKKKHYHLLPHQELNLNIVIRKL